MIFLALGTLADIRMLGCNKNILIQNHLLYMLFLGHDIISILDNIETFQEKFKLSLNTFENIL